MMSDLLFKSWIAGACHRQLRSLIFSYQTSKTTHEIDRALRAGRNSPERIRKLDFHHRILCGMNSVASIPSSYISSLVAGKPIARILAHPCIPHASFDIMPERVKTKARTPVVTQRAGQQLLSQPIACLSPPIIVCRSGNCKQRAYPLFPRALPHIAQEAKSDQLFVQWNNAF